MCHPLPRSAVVLCTALVLASCDAAERIAADVLISQEQERQLGLQIKKELETKEGLKYYADPEVEAYVKGVANKIIAQSRDDRDGEWFVYVVDDPDTVNAFATPGGHLYILTGLILQAKNEAELAGILGHEAGHVVARHSARQMVVAFGLETVVGMALGEDPGTLAEVASTLAANGALLAHGRSDETESDEYGARYTSASSYSPDGLITFFEALQALQGQQPEAMKWISTHPPHEERVSHLREYIQENGLSGSDLGADRIAPIQERIRSRVGINP